MKTSPEINELAGALSKAQGTFTNPPRNRAVKVTLKAGGNYTFHYTTLDCIIDMIRPGLSANGLSFVQSVGLDTDWVIVGTRLMHSSGQWIEDELPVKPDGFGPQQIGSAITYGKRYLLTALLGVASDEDDDGNLGSGHTSEEMQRSPPPKRNGKKAEADKIAAEHGMTTAEKLDLPRPDKSAVFESWATFILAITPNSFDEDLGAIRQTINDGKVKAPHVEPILRAAAKRAETAGQFDILDRLLLPLKETIRADDEGWTKLAIDIDEQRGIKLGDPVTA